MPAPQVVVVQLHWLCAVPSGAVAVGRADVGGKARAVLISSWRICAGVRSGFTDSISAAVPETSGAEKLVPMVALYASV